MPSEVYNQFENPGYWERMSFVVVAQHCMAIHYGKYTPTEAECEAIERRLGQFLDALTNCQAAISRARQLAWATGAGEAMREAFKED